MDRRTFLSRLTIGLAGLLSALLGLPVLGYLLAPLFARAADAFVDVGRVEDFARDSVGLVRFKDPSPLPWAGRTADTAIWVRRAPQGREPEFQVFAENCTHLGCPVEWRPAARLFMCPCHGGVFHEDGRVASGPPTQPLFEREWQVQGGRLLVRGTVLPTVRRRQ
ncbi:MAG TPA: Rieske 2Fe-2S domain-containing protein [Candidatus Limnocylindria bacterium]|jgi:menaquinol-cytochrome c reductase iron-sulfur subunit|nr:Rieske 2Fe-2S domain-containing protein [Candidatus Limnocylindria bacterium]